MTSPTPTAVRQDPPAGSAIPANGSFRRIRSLARAEILLLLRSRITLFNSIVVPPLAVSVVAMSTIDVSQGLRSTSYAVILLTSFLVVALPFVVYYNLTTTLVARREQLVLKGLLTGEASRREVIVACSVPTVLVMWAQFTLVAVVAFIWLTLPVPINGLWLTLALVAGTVLFVLLAVVSSGLTRSVEAAQWTTTPLLLASMLLSNGFIPVSAFPQALGAVAQWTPMYPVVALFQHGWGTAGLDGVVRSGGLQDVTQPLVCLTLWLVVAALAAKRWMRWEPRR
jgi:ABC-2 type transport system permease protein